MLLLEGREKPRTNDDSLYDVYYLMRPIDGVPNGFMIERKYQFTHDGMPPIRGAKNSYVVNIDEYDDVLWVRNNLELIFRFLELQYNGDNIWFRDYTEGEWDGEYHEFDETGDPEAIVKYMSILLYSNNHIIDLGNGECSEVFIAPSERFHKDIDEYLKTEETKEEDK